MPEVEIRHNPYRVQTEIRVDGRDIGPASALNDLDFVWKAFGGTSALGLLLSSNSFSETRWHLVCGKTGTP